jgi:hypothetical protein
MWSRHPTIAAHGHANGVLQTAQGEARCGRPERDTMATLGHELQHAIEALSAPPRVTDAVRISAERLTAHARCGRRAADTRPDGTRAWRVPQAPRTAPSLDAQARSWQIPRPAHPRRYRTDQQIAQLFQRTSSLSDRPIFEINKPAWSRAADEFSDKGAPDIVLLNCPESTRNQTPQPSSVARRMGIACDDTRAENCQALEAYLLNRFFF